MNHIFYYLERKYNLQTQANFLRNSVNSSKYVLNSLALFASKVWQMISIEIKNKKNFEDFKSNIKKLEPNKYKDFMQSLGYTEAATKGVL